jgi:hypothetical protein
MPSRSSAVRERTAGARVANGRETPRRPSAAGASAHRGAYEAQDAGRRDGPAQPRGKEGRPARAGRRAMRRGRAEARGLVLRFGFAQLTTDWLTNRLTCRRGVSGASGPRSWRSTAGRSRRRGAGRRRRSSTRDQAGWRARKPGRARALPRPGRSRWRRRGGRLGPPGSRPGRGGDPGGPRGRAGARGKGATWPRGAAPGAAARAGGVHEDEVIGRAGRRESPSVGSACAGARGGRSPCGAGRRSWAWSRRSGKPPRRGLAAPAGAKVENPGRRPRMGMRRTAARRRRPEAPRARA